jgi:hypothetical protein
MEDLPDPLTVMFQQVMEADPSDIADPPAWYLSFVDVEGDEDEWLGACIVRAPVESAAVAIAHIKGCNPGGQVVIYGPIPLDKVNPTYMDRLLDREEVEEAGV